MRRQAWTIPSVNTSSRSRPIREFSSTLTATNSTTPLAADRCHSACCSGKAHQASQAITSGLKEIPHGEGEQPAAEDRLERRPLGAARTVFTVPS